jgi:3-methyladenine DNA glycosylase Mpg
MALLAEGDPAAARRALERARDLFAEGGRKGLEPARTELRLAVACRRAGDEEASRAALVRARELHAGLEDDARSRALLRELE